MCQFLTFKAIDEVKARNQVNVHNDNDLHVRLNQDLIALEAKYHSKCKKKYIKATLAEASTQGVVGSDDATFKVLIESMDVRLLSGKALQLAELTTVINDLETTACQNEDPVKQLKLYTSKNLMIKLR